MSRCCASVLSVVFISGIFGCSGDSGPPKAEVFPVSGKVTVGGKALAGCTVVFSTENPAEGAAGGYSGEIGDDGSYTLSDSDGNSGAAPGKYKIIFIQAPEAAKEAMMNGGGQPGSEGPFPKEFASPETSTKEVEVTSDENTIDIDV
jgi:hypothetical protein